MRRVGLKGGGQVGDGATVVRKRAVANALVSQWRVNADAAVARFSCRSRSEVQIGTEFDVIAMQLNSTHWKNPEARANVQVRTDLLSSTVPSLG